MKDIAGRTAIVTGGASGIGLGIARAFAGQGVRVVVADINGEGAEEAAVGLGGDAVGFRLDVTDPTGWRDLVGRVNERFGGIDILCNNAGVVGAFKPLLDIDIDRIRRLYEVNVMGAILGIQAVAPQMKARGYGHIVNTSSMSALDSVPTLSGYSSSKRALLGISEALRDELAPFGVGVTALCPGMVATGLSRNTQRVLGEEGLDDAAKALTAGAPAGLNPDDVGPMVVAAIQENRMFAFTEGRHRERVEGRLEPVWQGFDWFKGR